VAVDAARNPLAACSRSWLAVCHAATTSSASRRLNDWANSAGLARKAQAHSRLKRKSARLEGRRLHG